MFLSKRAVSFVSLFVFIAVIFCSSARSQETASQCVQCHTNLKKLIRLCWEVEKLKPKAGTSSETSGEG
mgnify:CR=1 FL=1